jgi:ribosomal protein S18 acetylase RimI-like enzyme
MKAFKSFLYFVNAAFVGLCLALLAGSRGKCHAFRCPHILPSHTIQRGLLQRPSYSSCHLFFRVNGAEKSSGASSSVLGELSYANITLPCSVALETASDNVKESLTIRLLETEDVDQVTQMCCREYGSKSSSLLDFPWQKPTVSAIEDWFDAVTLRPLVEVTMRLKIQESCLQNHAVLVACLGAKIVGMVEISRQPPLPDRNPPPFAMPLWLKQTYCRVYKVGPLEGWITNLLITPEHRGRGIGKALVKASEGMARKWGSRSIHLHCDADTVSGHIPQRLYQSMGYHKVADEKAEYSWMGSAILSTSVYLVDGVPLLYLRKELV